MVVTILHLLRVVFTGAYARPRRFNYLLGLGLLVLCLFLDFTGYVLRWDEGIRWALVAGTNLVRSIPLLGNVLYGMLVGGSQPGPATLVRFYAWHIFGLTLPLVLVGIWHIFRVRRDGGIAVPPPEHRQDHARISRNELVRREILAIAPVRRPAGDRFRPVPGAHSPADQPGRYVCRRRAGALVLPVGAAAPAFQESIPLGRRPAPVRAAVAGPPAVRAAGRPAARTGSLVPERQPAGEHLGGPARIRDPDFDPAGAAMRALAVLASALLLASLLLAWFVESRSPAPVPLTPTLTGEIEYCLTCHGDLPEISPSHAVQTFGCVRCHGGERLALDADLAHSSMRGGANPSDLAVVEASCGGSDCHSWQPAAARIAIISSAC